MLTPERIAQIRQAPHGPDVAAMLDEIEIGRAHAVLLADWFAREFGPATIGLGAAGKCDLASRQLRRIEAAMQRTIALLEATR